MRSFSERLNKYSLFAKAARRKSFVSEGQWLQVWGFVKLHVKKTQDLCYNVLSIQNGDCQNRYIKQSNTMVE